MCVQKEFTDCLFKGDMNSVYLILLLFLNSVQECVLNFIVPMIEKWAKNYIL